MIRIAILCALLLTISTSYSFADPSKFLESYCQVRGLSDAQCTCAKDTFMQEAQNIGMSDEEVLIAALFSGQSGMDPMEFAAELQKLDRNLMANVMPAVGQIRTQIELSCQRSDVAATGDFVSKASPKIQERFLQACLFSNGLDPDEKQMCECQSRGFLEKLSDQGFLLMTEVMEAEASGAAGSMEPMEYVLFKERGLSQSQAEQLMSELQPELMQLVPIAMQCATEQYGGDAASDD